MYVLIDTARMYIRTNMETRISSHAYVSKYNKLMSSSYIEFVYK